jgi:hypothetical protein
MTSNCLGSFMELVQPLAVDNRPPPMAPGYRPTEALVLTMSHCLFTIPPANGPV